MPNVSIIIPTYNTSEYLVQALESCLEQTYKDYEIIVINDASTDNTDELLKPHIGRIKYIKLDKNVGQSKARNIGFLNSSGGYIAFLDADDIWTPDKLKLQIEILDKNLQIGLIHSDMEYFNSNGQVVSNLQTIRNYIPQGSCFNKLFLGEFHKTQTSSVVIRRTCFEKVGLFDETLRGSEDYNLWMRIAWNYEFAYLDKVLVRYRKHSYNTSKNLFIMYESELRAVEKILKNHPEIWKKLPPNLIRKRLSRLAFTVGYYCFDNYDLSNAKEYLWRAIKYEPRIIKSYPYYLLSLFNKKMITCIKDLKHYFTKSVKQKCILFTNFYADLGGGELCLLAHIDKLNIKQKGIEIALMQNGKLFNELSKRGIISHCIPWKNNNRLQRFIYGTLAISKLYAIIKYGKFGLVISYTYPDLILAAIAAKIAGVPVIWRSQAEIFPYINSKKKWFARLTVWFLNKFVGFIIPTTEYDKNLMLSYGINPKIIKVVRLGIELKNFEQIKPSNELRKEFDISPDAQLIGFAGRLVPWKGHELFIRALAGIKHLNLNFHALIVGDTTLNLNDPENFRAKLIKLVIDLGLSKYVTFTGFRNDIPKIMKELDIFVHASLKEPFGMVIVEAMAASKAVIASNVSGPKEIVINGETGLLIEPNNVQALVSAIQYLMNNRDVARTMGEKGRKRVEELFDLKRNIKMIDEISLNLIQSYK